MSLRYVEGFADRLPYALRVQVVDYARSINDAAEDIFTEAKRKMTDELRDQLTLLAAIRKLHAICSSSFWILYNSAELLGPNVSAIRAGSRIYSPATRDFAALQMLLNNLDETLEAQGITRDLLHRPCPKTLNPPLRHKALWADQIGHHIHYQRVHLLCTLP
jgi:hypothetical protein